MISPVDCKHHQTLFIKQSRWSGNSGSGSHYVRVCKDCGEFIVSGHHQGNAFRLTFTLDSDECVAAAGQYAKFLSQSEPGAAIDDEQHPA